MADVSNYGIQLLASSTSIGTIVSVDPPEVVQEAIETTNHGGGGFKEFISSGLKELKDFTATVSLDTTGVGLVDDLLEGTETAYTMVFPDADATTITFSALITSAKPSSADAASPEQLTLEITFQPTGSFTFAAAEVEG